MRSFCAAGVALAFALAACTTTSGTLPMSVASQAEARAPVTILVSIDGFHPGYLDRGVTPNLSRLAAGGVTGPMRPSFPSKTFPNHYTLVTGLRPDRNGIVANRMEDDRRPGEVFTMASDDPFWWNEATPIWVDAERAGIRTGITFWPGSNVANGATRAKEWPNAITGGSRPSDWAQFNQAISGTQRVNAVLDLLRRPAEIRPRFTTLYFDSVDTAGHRFGPAARETTDAVAEVDRWVGQLVRGLAAMRQPANLVIVADHGMAATSTTRLVRLDQIADPADYRLVEAGPYAALDAVPGHEAALEKRLLGRHAHAECWRKAQFPARFHYGRNARVPDYLCLAEVGWQITDRAPEHASEGGSHGYDHEAAEMLALFVANGPAFAPGGRVPTFDNVDVYPLLRRLIGLPPEPSDGDPDRFAGALAR